MSDHPARLRRLAKLAAPTTAAALAATLAVAAFTDDAQNAGNRATAADVTITADVAATTPLFDLADWQPGEDGGTVARCVGLTNGGSIPVPVALRLAGAPTGQLADFVDMTVERGTRDTAVSDAGCAGFATDGVVFRGELDEFPTSAGAAIADGGAPLAVGAERAYRVTWTLQDTEAAEGRSLGGVDFRWETTSAG
jgi:hypothetical protein